MALALAMPATVLAGTSRQEDVAALIAQDALVARVSARLMRANASLCPTQAPQAGFVVHAPVQYAPAYREPLAALTGLRTGFGISAIIAGSPAERAGLRAGDRLLAIEGEPLPASRSRGATYGPVAAAHAAIGRAMGDGRLALTVERAGRTIDLSFVPDAGCAVQVQVVGGRRWGASADGKVISVASGLVAANPADGQLAFAIAHELAHVVYGDSGPDPKLTPQSREQRADIVALALMARAGYDPQDGVRFWQAYRAAHGIDRFEQVDHASPSVRAATVAAAAQAMSERLVAGRSPWPKEFPAPR